MSFLSVIRKFGTFASDLGTAAVSIAPIATPIVSTFNPAAGAILGTIFKAIANAEEAIGVHPPGDIDPMAGDAKKTIRRSGAVLASVTSSAARKRNIATGIVSQQLLDHVNAALAQEGVKINATPELMANVMTHSQTAIDHAVALSNSVTQMLAELQKEAVPLPPPPPTEQAQTTGEPAGVHDEAGPEKP